MITDRYTDLLCEIKDVLYKCRPHSDLYESVGLSSTQPYVLDYRERTRVYLFSSTALTLSIGQAGNIGTVNVTANSWLELHFPESTPIYTNTTQVNYVLILCTDHMLTHPV
jgi:hypothetical protein